MAAKEYEIMLCKNGNLYINKAEGNNFRSSDSKAFTEEDYNQVKQWLTKSIWHDACEDAEDNRAVLIITEYNEFLCHPTNPTVKAGGSLTIKSYHTIKSGHMWKTYFPSGVK